MVAYICTGCGGCRAIYESVPLSKKEKVTKQIKLDKSQSPNSTPNSIAIIYHLISVFSFCQFFPSTCSYRLTELISNIVECLRVCSVVWRMFFLVLSRLIFFYVSLRGSFLCTKWIITAHTIHPDMKTHKRTWMCIHIVLLLNHLNNLIRWSPVSFYFFRFSNGA